MELAAQLTGSVLIVSLNGNLDVTTSQTVVEFLNRQLQEGRYKLVADFSQLGYISSAGLRALLMAAKEARRQGGDLRVAAVGSDEVDKVLQMSGFSNILKIYPDTAAAAASFTA